MAAALATPAAPPPDRGPGTVQVLKLRSENGQEWADSASGIQHRWGETTGKRPHKDDYWTAQAIGGEQQEESDAPTVWAAPPDGRTLTIPPAPRAARPPQATAQEAQKIVRAHYAGQILGDLQRLAEHSSEAIGARYAASLLRTMRTMRDLAPFDPFVEVLMALHDALTFENRWAGYSSKQFRGAHEAIRKLTRPKRLTEDKAEKAMATLEDLGFDTTPFAAETGGES